MWAEGQAGRTAFTPLLSLGWHRAPQDLGTDSACSVTSEEDHTDQYPAGDRKLEAWAWPHHLALT